MKKSCIVTVLLFFLVGTIYSQQYANHLSAEKLILDNGIITRIVNLGNAKEG
ncbi:MAG: hypothetical protein IPN68_17605 [Bacteroidetes bacterium]|nr:hypothetical protein [Bacteroidota bacterium]